MNPTGRQPGFRLSLADLCMIGGGSILTWICWSILGSFAMIFAIVVFHFFLFCNVFRVRRKLELIWAMAFVINVLIWSQCGVLNWWYILASQFPATAAVIAIEIASPRYHGIGYAIKQRHVISEKSHS